MKPINYNTLTGSFYYVVDMMIGNSNVTSFELGEATQAKFLYPLHALTAIMIHFLNMLIAIMGNTFAERSADIDKIYYRDHLNFVLDNWYVL